LRFVVEETFEGRSEQLKEYLVGLAVFDRDASFDPRADPIVRVEAGRLRDKLAKYYELEGAQDSIVISIPRGSYVPRVRGPGPTPSRLQRARKWIAARSDRKTKLLVLTSFLTITLGLTVAFLVSRNRELESKIAATNTAVSASDPVWHPFFSSPADTVIVFGSPIFFASEPDRLFLRLYSVNDPRNWQNNPDYQKLRGLFPYLSEPRYDYVEMGEAIALQKLTAFFGQHGRTVKAAPAHLTNWEAVKNSNIVFLGPTRFNPLLQRLPQQLDFELGPDFAFHNLKPRPGEAKVYSTPSHRDTLSYAVVASFPGLLLNRRIMILTAHSTAGTVAATEYVTRPELLREMIGKLELADNPLQSYQILLRVFSDEDEPFKTEYVTHHSTPLE